MYLMSKQCINKIGTNLPIVISKSTNALSNSFSKISSHLNPTPAIFNTDLTTANASAKASTDSTSFCASLIRVCSDSKTFN